MRVIWSIQSLNDLDAIYEYIAKDSPIYAQSECLSQLSL